MAKKLFEWEKQLFQDLRELIIGVEISSDGGNQIYMRTWQKNNIRNKFICSHMKGIESKLE